MKYHQKNTAKDQGVVAIIITVVVMLVLTLIIITFARVARREQRQALDRQLNTQAFYAAESGINDAIEELKDPTSPYRNNEKNDCNPLPNASNQLDGATGAIAYSCVLIDPTPISFQLSSLSPGESKVFKIEREGGGNVSQISIYWQDSNENERFDGCPGNNNYRTFPTTWSTDTCGPGMLRADMIRIPNGNFSRTQLTNEAFTSFMVPTRRSGGNAYTGTGAISLTGNQGFGNQGVVSPAACPAYNTGTGVITTPNTPTRPRHCVVRITNLNAPRFYLRLSSLYKAASVEICTPDCGSNATVAFASGSQAKVDATGRVSDVLRRVQVYVDSTDSGPFPFPLNAVESGEAICKRFSDAPPAFLSGDTGLSGSCAVPSS